METAATTAKTGQNWNMLCSPPSYIINMAPKIYTIVLFQGILSMKIAVDESKKKKKKKKIGVQMCVQGSSLLGVVGMDIW